MRFQLLIHDIKPEELAEVVEVFGSAEVDSLGAGQGRFNVIPHWIENDPHWLAVIVNDLERRLNADEHRLHQVWVDKVQRDRDPIEEDIELMKRFLATDGPNQKLRSDLGEVFPQVWSAG